MRACAQPALLFKKVFHFMMRLESLCIYLFIYLFIHLFTKCINVIGKNKSA